MDGLLRFSETARRDPAIDIWLSERVPDLGDIAREWSGCGNVATTFES
jgi:hypothetical protein